MAEEKKKDKPERKGGMIFQRKSAVKPDAEGGQQYPADSMRAEMMITIKAADANTEQEVNVGRVGNKDADEHLNAPLPDQLQCFPQAGASWRKTPNSEGKTNHAMGYW